MSQNGEAIRFEGVTKQFGDAVAVDDLNLTVGRNEFFSLLGPSGCGKTTTLRMVAGFEQPTEGAVYLDGEAVDRVPPYERNVNTVFQSYALFEHLDVEGNVSFGLKRRKVDGNEIKTRVAEALELPLEEDASVLTFIQQRFAKRGWKMPEVNRRQAQVPRGAIVLPNPNGTAPGLWIERHGRGVALLPGPPREMRPMLQLLATERLASWSGGMRLHRRVLKIGGRGESRVEELVQPIYSQWLQLPQPIETTILATPGQIELHLTMRDSDAGRAAASLERAVAQIEQVLGPDIFSKDGGQIEAVVGDLLVARGWRIALGESCTGGLATSRLTDVSGSSAYVDMTVVAYSNAAKVDLLGVPASLIEAHGAVSEPVAAAMAEGARARAGVEVGVGITGIAGPSGGTEQKPVGTVCIAVSVPRVSDPPHQPYPPDQPNESVTHVRTFRFVGGREMVKAFASFAALDMVRRVLIGAHVDVDWIRRS